MRRFPILQTNPSNNHFSCYKTINHNKLDLFFVSKKPPSRCLKHRMATTTMATAHHQHKIIVILGPTGCGKSKLSVDLASRFFPSSEIINSDKIQVYTGLDITTNKIPYQDRKNVPHHLLGSEKHPEFTPSDFRASASLTISQILARRNLPFIVGGSNSFIHALLVNKFNPEIDVFNESFSSSISGEEELRYKCCFIWVDVSQPLLNQYLVKRVDDMLDSGMYEELQEYFADPESKSMSRDGLNKAIGVPEFRDYFKRFSNNKGHDLTIDGDVERMVGYEKAVRAIKDNTCQLAKRQLWKILRLRDVAGWDLKRVDATASVRAAMCGRRVADIWERTVVEPSVKIVKQFLIE